jgi:hypothetical protein
MPLGLIFWILMLLWLLFGLGLQFGWFGPNQQYATWGNTLLLFLLFALLGWRVFGAAVQG